MGRVFTLLRDRQQITFKFLNTICLLISAPTSSISRLTDRFLFENFVNFFFLARYKMSNQRSGTKSVSNVSIISIFRGNIMF